MSKTIKSKCTYLNCNKLGRHKITGIAINLCKKHHRSLKKLIIDLRERKEREDKNA